MDSMWVYFLICVGISVVSWYMGVRSGYKLGFHDGQKAGVFLGGLFAGFSAPPSSSVSEKKEGNNVLPFPPDDETKGGNA